MADTTEVRDLSFLTLLALQEADCFRRREETDARYLAALAARLAETLDLDGNGLGALPPSTVVMYASALRAATGSDRTDGAHVAKGLKRTIASMRDMAALAAKGGADTIAAHELRSAMAFLRALHDQLLGQKRAEAARRATNRILRGRE